MPSTLFVHDPEFYSAIKDIDLTEIVPQPDHFGYLLRAIAFQQVSGSLGANFQGSFLQSFPIQNPRPQDILDMPFDQFREAGLSGQKSTYMQNIAHYWIEHGVTDEMLAAMPDDELIAFLTRIKGVGRWTAEMLMIFGMGRKDVFPLDDIAIQEGFVQIFGLQHLHLKEIKRRMAQRSENWKPNRSCAARLIWAWKAKRDADTGKV